MKLELLYNEKLETVVVPDSVKIQIIEPKIMARTQSDSELIQEALKNPIDSLPFADYVAKHESFLLILNDHARSTPTPVVLREILPFLKDKNLKVIIASGTHNLPSDNDLRTLILGDFYDELKPSLVFHVSKSGDFVYIGSTKRGTELKLNTIIEEFDAIITINSIEPHYFAGFTGGRKSFLPGIAAHDSIEANHSMALLDEARILELKGNPLHEDLEEATHLIVDKRSVFAVNVVLDGEGKIVGAYGGDIFAQLYKGAELARKIYAPVIAEPPDMLIAVVHPPLDQNLYQAQKGFENCRLALKEGGVFVLVSSCCDGIGPEDYAEMLQSAESIEEFATKFEEIKVNYQLGWHKVGTIPPFLKNHKLWMVSTLPRQTLTKMFIEGFDSIQAAVDKAMDSLGREINILIVKDSGNVCPILE